MKDTLTEFIQETFGGKRSTLDQLDDEIKTIDGLTKTIERINEELTKHFDMESIALRKWIDKCAVLEDKVKLYDRALMVACEEYEHYVKDSRGNPCACSLGELTDGRPDDCDNDCGACLKAYFLRRGQDNVDMKQFCKGEIDKANAVKKGQMISKGRSYWWDYRVLRRVIDGDDTYGIYEVFYNEQDEPFLCTEDACKPYGDTIDELRQNLQWMMEALDEPVLD